MLPLECDEKQRFTGSKELVLSNKESKVNYDKLNW